MSAKCANCGYDAEPDPPREMCPNCGAVAVAVKRAVDEPQPGEP